jgi:hypothetical protein
VLPEEDAAEFAALEAALLEELAPVGALQAVLARRVAVAAWRLERADRLEAEVLEFRSYEGANAGLALIRDGNATRSFETLLRYRGAAMAEFWRALKTLKALQAEPAREAGDRPAPAMRPLRPAAQPPRVDRARPNEPERALEPGLDYLPSEPPAPRTLHEPAALWTPNEPETSPARPEYLLNEPAHEPDAPWRPNEPETGPMVAVPHLSQLPTSIQPAAALSARTAPPRRISRRS